MVLIYVVDFVVVVLAFASENRTVINYRVILL